MSEWENNHVQFARVLNYIRKSNPPVKFLERVAKDMGVTLSDLQELLNRSSEVWEDVRHRL